MGIQTIQEINSQTKNQTAIRSAAHRDVPRWLWIGLPLMGLAVLLGGAMIQDFDLWSFWVVSEYGFLESFTALFFAAVFVVAMLIYRRRAELPGRMGMFVLVIGLGGLFAAGEETSWGQWYVKWDTPAAMEKINRQKETNLHNIKFDPSTFWGHIGNQAVSFFFNRGPRTLLMLMCMFIGIGMPILLRKRRLGLDPAKHVWFWLIPTHVVIATAVLAVLSTVPEHTFDALGTRRLVEKETYAYKAFLGDAPGEFKEYCFAGFLLIYLLSILRRMGPRPERRD